MSIKIEVFPDSVITIQKKFGPVTEQTAYAHLVDRDGVIEKFPRKIVLRLENPSNAYPPGHYTIEASSFTVGDYDKLEVKYLRLRPLPVAAQKAA